MMVSLGVGGVAAGIMHLLAHGFFKALLFLGSGSVIHGCHEEQDIRKMGGLRKVMPVTFVTYAIGMMALSGVPLFFSGAWTKEEILHATAHWAKSPWPYYLMLAGVVLTALYMTRQMIYVFYGNRRGNIGFQPVRPAGLQPAEPSASDSVKESPPVMTRPLIVLAICTVGLSAVLTPAWPWLHDYLSGESPHLDFRLLIQPMLFVSLALVAVGIGLGVLIYRRAGFTDPFQQAQPALFRFLENKMWLDELYAHTVIALSKTSALISSWMDRFVWDGLVRGVGWLGRFFGSFSAGVDERGINAGVDETVGGTQGLGRLMAKFHSGQIQWYLGAVAVAVLALLLFYAWLA
jgi:NADH-quinone oxidoreductase subunit L